MARLSTAEEYAAEQGRRLDRFARAAGDNWADDEPPAHAPRSPSHALRVDALQTHHGLQYVARCSCHWMSPFEDGAHQVRRTWQTHADWTSRVEAHRSGK